MASMSLKVVPALWVYQGKVGRLSEAAQARLHRESYGGTIPHPHAAAYASP